MRLKLGSIGTGRKVFKLATRLAKGGAAKCSRGTARAEAEPWLRAHRRRLPDLVGCAAMFVEDCTHFGLLFGKRTGTPMRSARVG